MRSRGRCHMVVEFTASYSNRVNHH